MNNNKVKVLICYHSSNYGGVEQHILDLVTGLSKEFEIIVTCPQGPLVQKYLDAGASACLNLYPKNEFDLFYVYKVFALIKKEKISVVHAHELKSGVLAIFAAFLARAHIRIYHVHTPFSHWRQNILKKYPALLINTIVNCIVGNFFATDVIALTSSIKEIRTKKEFIKSVKIRVIPNGVSLDKFSFDMNERELFRNRNYIDDKCILIGNISRFTEEKGHRFLISSFKKFLEIASPSMDYKLLLAGGGKLLEEIRDLSVKHGIPNKVIFTDKFEETEKKSILSAIDLFVMPTYAEGFGIALVEAMANGRPCLVSNLSVLKDVGNNAIDYFQMDDINGFASKIADIVSDPNLLKSMSEKSTMRAKNFTMDLFWQNYRNLYNS